MSDIPHVVILGGGFGGLAAANRLRDSLDTSQVKITLIDRKNWFMVGFAKLWIINGTRTFENSTGDISKISEKGIEFVCGEINGIDFDSRIVTTSVCSVRYDFLIVALGARLAPEKIPGLEQNGMNLYDHKQLIRIRGEILNIKSGKIAVCIMGMPYKCPPAPYEACLLIRSMLGAQSSVQIDVYSPAPITLPAAGAKISEQILEMISSEDIKFHGSCKTVRVEKNVLVFEDGRRSDFDLLFAIPPHTAPKVIYRCGLARPGQFIQIDRDCKTIHENVYAIGDVTLLPAGEKLAVPKAGIFAEGQGEMVAENIVSVMSGETGSLLYTGQGGCFIESGRNTASVIDVDMFGGRTPVTRLSEPTRQNLQSKLDFEKQRLQKWL